MTFKSVDNILMTDFTAHGNGGDMGLVKIPPGARKPFRITRKNLVGFISISTSLLSQLDCLLT